MNPASLLSLPESAHFDRKSRLLVVENAGNPDHHDHLKDFVRHVVALANFARLSGRSACLLFGVDDAKHQGGIKAANGIGIRDQSAITSDQVVWPVDDDSMLETHWKKHVKDPYEKAIRTWVGPRRRPPIKGADWQSELQYHLELVSIGTALVAALIMKPTLTDDPFFVDRYRELGLEARHFVRVNDNSVPIGEVEAKRLLTRWTEQPYLSPAVWRNYLESLRSAVGDVFPEDPNTSDAFQDIFLENLESSQHYEFRELWRHITASDASSSQFIVFFGEPGTGKTSCLKRSIYEQAGTALTELENDADLLEPRTWIPVYVPLDSYDGHQDVDQIVTNRIGELLAKAGERGPTIDAKLLTARELRFIVTIDAVDEIPEDRIEDSARRIDAFAKAYVSANHAITSREVRCPERWKRGHSSYRVRPLSMAQVQSFLGSRLSQEQMDSPRLALLLDELASLLCIPRLLHAFLTYVENNPVPNAGTAVHAILERIWSHEQSLSRGWSGSIDRYRKPLHDYAVRCIEENIQGLCQDEDHDLPDVDWYLNAGLLRLTGKYPRHISFPHPEFIDCLNAQILTRAVERRSAVYQQMKERLESALMLHSEHRFRTARYLINLGEADISLSPWDEWIRILPDPVTRLRVIAERLVVTFGDTSILSEALGDLNTAKDYQDNSVFWLRQLLQDPNSQVAECVLSTMDATLLESVEQLVTLMLDDTGHQNLQFLALRRLLDADPAGDRTEPKATIKNWLNDFGEPGHVEVALNMVDEYQLLWAGEEVFEVASNELYSSELRARAVEILGKLGDPRYPVIAEMLEPSRQAEDTTKDVDNSRVDFFQTSLSAPTSDPIETEAHSFDQEET